MNRKQKNIFYSLTLFMIICAVLFTVATKTFDVRPIGQNGTPVGFAGINQSVHNALGVHMTLYTLTEITGYIAIAVAGIFGVIGVLQLVKRRSIKKVDTSLLILGGYLVLVIGTYLLFEKVVINYRPILMDGQLEASYPSSHSMIVYCILTAAIVQFNLMKFPKGAKITFSVISAIIIAFTVVARLWSGVHWFSDIIGGLLIGSALIGIYLSCLMATDTQN